MAKSVVLAAAVLGSSVQAWAHPSQMGDIVGTNIQLRTIGHAFSGSIKDRVVMGFKKRGMFVSELRIIEGDQEALSEFRAKQGGGFGGQLMLRDPEQLDQLQAHRIELIELVKADNIYVMRFGDRRVEVRVEAEAFENGHFVNPEFTAVVDDEVIRFQMTNGKACYGYALHLITMIMGAAIF